MKPLHLAVMGIIMSLIVWGSLFLTVLNQSHRTNELLKNDHKLLSQDTAILNAERTTQTDLEAKIADLQRHVDCLFNLATQNNPYARISNASTCTISSATPSSSSRASAPSSSPTPASSPQSVPNSDNKQATPAPKPSLVRQLLNKL